MNEKIDLDNDDPLIKEMEGFANKEAKRRQLDLRNPPKNLKEVYKRLDKWLTRYDRNMVDLILAVTLSNKATNTKPLWLFLVGKSADGKSEIVGALKGYYNTELLDQITPNTLATGKTYKNKKVDDLGGKLANSSHILLFSDLASLKSVNPDSKNAIWGQFRELYEGKIYKTTGNATTVKYNNCHVTLIACSTSDIKAEYTISNQLGTREFIYDIISKREDNDEKMKKALEHLEKESEMKKELRETIQGFLSTRTFNKDIKVNDETMEWMYDKCNELATFRASAQFERQTGELRNFVDEEVPTRLIQQMVLLYKSLKSLEKDYPDEKIKTIVSNIVRASGEPIRQKVYHFFKNNPGMEYHMMGLHEELHIGRQTLKKQCEVLTYMDYLVRRVETEQYGANNNLEREIVYYQWKKKKDWFKKEL